MNRYSLGFFLLIAGISLQFFETGNAASLERITKQKTPYMFLASISEPPIESKIKTWRYSLLVRQIQLRLAEIGLYKGRIAGVMSAETADAIRTFQRIANLTVDGKANHILLDRLTSAAAEGEKLLTRLDRAQKEQIKAAYRDLEKTFGRDWETKTRPLVVGASRDQSYLKLRTRRCYENPNPSCLIVEAELAAERIEKVKLRDWALSDIVQVQAQTGQLEAAMRVIKAINDPRAIISALGGIAVTLSRVGRTREALSAAWRVPSQSARDKAFLAIAEGQLLANRPDFAENTALLINSPEQKLSVLVQIAHKYIANGSFKSARRLASESQVVASRVKEGLFYDRTLGQVASLLIALGDKKRAENLFLVIKNPYNRLKVLCDIALIEHRGGASTIAFKRLKEAENLLSMLSNSSESEEAHACLATSYSELMSLRAAFKHVDKIEFGHKFDFVLSRILLAMADNHQIVRATQSIDRIRDVKIRVNTMMTISNIAHNKGYDVFASQLAQKAIHLSTNISNLFDKVFILSDIAVSQLNSNNLSARKIIFSAIAIAAKIKDPWARARALSRVAGVLIMLNSK